MCGVSMHAYTVEILKGHTGTGDFVHCREVSEYISLSPCTSQKCVLTRSVY